ncbi:MAG: peptidoglycan-binding protein [Candidatus Baltobacteraceae bacterium]|jgi:hypothetical protein
MNWPLEQQGSTGENVRTVQYLLNAQGASLTVDGDFGPLTAAAVVAFQSANGLAADGIVGDETWPVLIADVSTGSAGAAVEAAQSQIFIRAGAEWVTVSGTYDAPTESAVKAFQGLIGLTVDGIVGPKTWHALVSGYLPAPSGEQASQALYDAWTHGDRNAAAKNATPQAVTELFAQTWHASDGWTFDQCSPGAGQVWCSWNRPGQNLSLKANAGDVAPFHFVDGASFQP